MALGTCWKGVRKEGRGGGNRGGENVISVKAKFAEEKSCRMWKIFILENFSGVLNFHFIDTQCYV